MNLFIFAHQDDEFGVFYEIEKLILSRERIVVVYLTSGSVDGSISERRNEESITVLCQMGVSRSDIYFLGGENAIPDGRLSSHIEKSFLILFDILQNIGMPSRIYSMAWEGGHQDHDAAYLVSLAIAKKINILENYYQFPLYTGMNVPWIIFRLFVANKLNGEPIVTKLSLASRIRYMKYIFTYSSQAKTWLILGPFLLLHYIFYGTQVLQKASLSRLSQRPHCGTMLYERRGFYTYDEFQIDIASFIKKYF